MTTAIVPYTEKTLTKEEQLDHIYAQVASGRAVTRVLEDDEGMPSKTMFWGWHRTDENIQNNLARAREHGVEALIDEAVEIADTPLMGEELMEEVGPDGTKRRRTAKEMLGHRRLQIETRINYARMIKPRKYGANVNHTIDPDAGRTIADAILEGNRRLQQAMLDKEKPTGSEGQGE